MKICHIAKITKFPKGKTVDTTNLQPVEIIHINFAFYNVTSIRYFTSIITIVCANTITICILPTLSKKFPVYIICFIFTILNNKQHP